jgi:hypothetical protein
MFRMIVPAEKLYFYRLCGTSMYSKVLGYNRPLQIKMAISRTFFKFEINGSGSQLKTIVAVWCTSNLKKLAKPPIVGSHQITQQNILQREGGP